MAIMRFGDETERGTLSKFYAYKSYLPSVDGGYPILVVYRTIEDDGGQCMIFEEEEVLQMEYIIAGYKKRKALQEAKGDDK